LLIIYKNKNRKIIKIRLKLRLLSNRLIRNIDKWDNEIVDIINVINIWSWYNILWYKISYLIYYLI
jgi:hypothetical protein